MNREDVYNLFSLDGRVAVVTGGAGKLGVKHAEVLSAAGASVALWDIDPAVSERAEKISAGVSGVVVDITKPEEVAKAVADLQNRFGRIDILINNAALDAKPERPESQLQFSPYEKYSIDMWNKEIAVGLTGTEISTQAVAPLMMEQKSGVVLNILSTLAVDAPDNRVYEKGKFKSVAYVTIKSALLGLTRAWASYLGLYNIRVNAVTFGGVNFGTHDAGFLDKKAAQVMLGRRAGPNEYQGVVLFLCSDASAFMTAANVVVDGGKTAW